MSGFDPNQLPDLLPIYYKRLFPFGPFYRWLSYGNVKKEYFENREFSFTLGEDIVIRYQAFANQNEMEDDIKKRCPYKIDIGAVFSHKPKNHRLVSSMFPEEKELVFDIDMTDYDDVRQCCQGADVCNKCWRFMSIAVQVLDTALRDDFGWEHLLWVFSGRRGVHCWVCDESARRLDQIQRGAVAEYLQIVTGGEHQGKKVSLPGDRLHPSISRSVEIIEKQFKTLVEEQDFFNNEGIANLLATIKDETLHNEIKKGVENCSSSKEKFNKIENIISYHRSKGNLKWRSKHLLEEIILQFAYPRLDINVSKGLNHLLKSPFCVHPKTGKVCVPFNPRAVQNFNPSTVPTIISLIEEIQKFDEKQQEIVTADAGKTRVKDYKKTSLNKSVTIFLEFLRRLEETWKGKLIQMSDEKMEF